MKPFLLAKKFVAGTELEEALDNSKNLRKKKIKITLDHLGENVKDKYKALDAKNAYLKIIKRVSREGKNYNISIKLSQIGLAVDYSFALENAVEIALKAKECNVGLEVDMEGYEYLEDTLKIYLSLIKKNSSVIQAIQAYLYRSERDIRDIIVKEGKIRLVKGSYKENKKVAYQDKRGINENYLKLMKIILKEGKFIAIGTHDEKIIDEAIDFINHNRISSKKFEFEMLYGVKTKLQEELAKDFPVRAYVPYGLEWAPYFYRRIRERKENLFFALRSIFS